MSLKIRTASEILQDAISYMILNTNLTDFNVGSVIRTILEEMAIEDAEQYTQILNVLNSFFLQNTSGAATDDRAAQYNVFRKLSTPSIGTVKFLDTGLQRSFLSSNAASGDPHVFVVNTRTFPSPPFIVRLGEGTGNEEDIEVSSVNSSANTLVFTTPNVLQFSHPKCLASVDEVENLQSLVCVVSGDPDRIISSGVTLRSKGSNVNVSIDAVTSSTGIHRNGNFASSDINVVTQQSGSSSVIPAKRLTGILSTKPFAGAAVVNLNAITGGRNIETDAALKTRITEKIAGLSSGTVDAIISRLRTTTDQTTSQSVEKYSVFEDFASRVVRVYINPGQDAFSPSRTLSILDTLSADILVMSTSASVTDTSDFPLVSAGYPQYLILDVENVYGLLETVQYVDIANNVLTLGTLPQNAPHSAGTQVCVPEILTENSGFNEKYYTLSRVPVEQNSLDLFMVQYVAGGFPTMADTVTTKLLPNFDYIINEATGQIEFLTIYTSPDGGNHIPPSGSILLASYNSYTGLVKYAQREIDGDLVDPVAYPGVRSAGVKVLVSAADILYLDISANISVDTAVVTRETALFITEQQILNYFTTRNIGQPVILSDIISLVMDIRGVTDIKITNPTENVSVGRNQIVAVGSLTLN